MSPNKILTYVVVAFLCGALVIGFTTANIINTTSLNGTTLTIATIAQWGIPTMALAALVLGGTKLFKGGRGR